MALDLSARLRENSCVVHEVGRRDAPAAIVDRVIERARGGVVAVAPADPLVAELALVAAMRDRDVTLLLPDAPDWTDALPNATVGLTGAALAVTEPAALAVVAAPHVPRAISLLPPVHVCVVRASDIVPDLAGAIASFAGALPSALTWIGGPSRTGDLEMITTLGVHGPTVVEVVIVDG